MLIFIKGEHDKAKPMLEQALRIRRKQSGNEHRDVAECLNNLAQLASDQVLCMHQNKKRPLFTCRSLHLRVMKKKRGLRLRKLSLYGGSA